MLILLLGGQRRTILNVIQKRQTNLIIICFAEVNFRNMWPTHSDVISIHRVAKRPGITIFHDMYCDEHVGNIVKKAWPIRSWVCCIG